MVGRYHYNWLIKLNVEKLEVEIVTIKLLHLYFKTQQQNTPYSIRIGSDDRKAVSHALHLNLLSYFRVTLAVFVMVSLSWELDYIHNGILLWVGEDISRQD